MREKRKTSNKKFNS